MKGDAQARGGDLVASLDCDALLCALVLAPTTYSRNRFFQLYQESEMRDVRRRASALRSLVRECVRNGLEPEVVSIGEGQYELQLTVEGIRFSRRTKVGTLELSLFKYLHARSKGLPADEERSRIELALAKLSA